MKDRPLTIILLAYVLLAGMYSIVTPIFEASDEVWHYPMVKYVADHASIPVQTPGVATAWRQEGSQPPLYYMMAAALTFWIDTSDLDRVRCLNPHADLGVIVPDGNVNIAVHNPAAESFPWHGTALAVHLARFLSVALGALTVLMTYRLCIELFPDQKGLALVAAALTAFNPMFLFISGSVNNDNLSNALASALLVMIMRLLKRPKESGAPSIRELALIGVLAGAGMLAKFNVGFLLPVIALALAWLAYRLRGLRFFVTGSLITGGLTILIAGWWYLRNWQLYGDFTGLNVFVQIVGPRAIPANWAQLWSERHTFLMSYWGFFGGLNVPLPDLVYTLFNGIAALALLGLLVGAIPHPLPPLPRRERGGSASPSPAMGEKGGGDEGKRPNWAILTGRAVTVVWIGALFGGLIRWTSATWASQGRLMFPAIAPLSMWMALGLWMLGKRLPRIRWRLPGAAVLWFAGMALISSVIIDRAYSLPGYFENPGDLRPDAAVSFHEPGSPQNGLKIQGPTDLFALIPKTVKPGDYLDFTIPISVPAGTHFTRDWSAFIHVENQSGVIVAQRDVYPGQGLIATSLLDTATNQVWHNHFAVHIPDYAYGPQTLQVYLGFYDARTNERMIAQNVSGDNRVYLGSVRLNSRPFQVNLGGEAELIGYEVAPESLVLHPGGSLTVTLFWRGLRPMTTDYRVFVQVVEPNTTRVFARSDAMPAAWARPTTTWKPGETIEDEHVLTVNADAAPGTWQLVVGMYRLADTPGGPQFYRLRMIAPDGSEAGDFVGLTRVKIEPPDYF